MFSIFNEFPRRTLRIIMKIHHPFIFDRCNFDFEPNNSDFNLHFAENSIRL